jgi:hypothetical protein
MKTGGYLFLLFPLFTLFGFQCSKEDQADIFTGKVVLEGICGRTVVEIVDGDMSLLSSGSYASRWIDPTTGSSYENAFMIGNICQIETTLRSGDQFTFTVHDQPNNSCITCLAWSAAPQEQLAIKLLSPRPR